MDDPLIIAGQELASRLILGTGGAPSPQVLDAAIAASGTAMSTVAMRRVDPGTSGSVLDVLIARGVRVLPNTAGCRTAREALLTAQLGREALETDWVKLEVVADDETLLPDPAELPPRVASPAEALRGRYHVTRTFTRPGLPVMEADSSVVTDCVRTGERCMSYLVVASGDLPLVFDGTAWVDSNQTEGPCPSGDLATLKADARFPLPEPAQNPIQRLNGHGTWVQTGSCAVELEYDETLTRTGD